MEAFGQKEEANLVDMLRSAREAVLSLVALEDERITGHILFSRMVAPTQTLGLAPVSVRPDRQGSGIGSALIREGIVRARRSGWHAVFVLGEPEYYRRFGFHQELAANFSSPYAGPYFMAQELQEGGLGDGMGDATYASAFSRLG